MKKFLLLLVGVLFALSAKAADYYLIGSFNNWTLKYNGCQFTTVTSTSGVYELQYTGTIGKNASFKVNDGTWDDVINLGASGSDKTITIGTAETYTNDKYSKNFIIPEALTNPYFLLDTNNKTLTVYKSKPFVPSETADVNGTYVYFDNSVKGWTEIAVWAWNNEGNCNSNGNWPGDAIHSGKTDGGYYFWALPSRKSTPANIIFNDNKKEGATQTGTFEFVNGAIYNFNGKQKDPSTQVIYFDANGTGWSSVKMRYCNAVSEEIEGTAVEGKNGVYKFVFATALPADAWTVKFTDGTSTLNTKSGFENYASGYVYKANGSNIEQAATTIEGYTPTIVTPTAYTIYFDAVRSGNGEVSLAVNGLESSAITVSEETVNNHQIKKYEYSAVADTKATFTYAGSSLGEFAPVSGQVYYYNGSAQDNEAFEGYTWTSGDTPEPDYFGKKIAISGSFYNEAWPGPVTDKAKKFTFVSGSTYTLDLTGYTFDATTEFKIYDVTGIADKNSWGQGYYNSTAIQPNAPTKLTADNNLGNNIKVDATIVNPQITLDVATWTITIKAQEVETTDDYYIHGTILGDNDWTSYKMTAQPDGTWTYTAAFKSEKGFGIRKTKHGQTNQIAWICDANKNASIVLGQVHNCVIKTKNDDVDWATPKNSFDGTTLYTLVFDPDKMTIVFINPTAVVATVATEATTIDGANANNLNVSFTVADYYKGAAATNYTLSNGSYSATSNDGNFTNVPYATNYTLKPDNGSAMPINITLPTTTFEINKPYFTVVAPGSGSGNASLVVYFKANCAWWYNLPQIVCTCGGETISGTVVWKSPEVGTEYEYDFAFIANGVVAYDSDLMTSKEDKTFKFVVTPVYPFAVEAPAATPAPSMMRAAANSVQYVAGAAVQCEDVEVTQHSAVSGVEGVMIEDEEAPVEYFNLQGQRVNGELAPGIYIRRQGSSVTKVRI